MAALTIFMTWAEFCSGNSQWTDLPQSRLVSTREQNAAQGPVPGTYVQWIPWLSNLLSSVQLTCCVGGKVAYWQLKQSTGVRSASGQKRLACSFNGYLSDICFVPGLVLCTTKETWVSFCLLLLAVLIPGLVLRPEHSLVWAMLVSFRARHWLSRNVNIFYWVVLLALVAIVCLFRGLYLCAKRIHGWFRGKCRNTEIPR